MPRLERIIVIVAVLIVVVGGAAWYWEREAPPTWTTPFQAVMLDSGVVYFGRLSGYGTAHPVLSDVYYVQSQVDPNTKAVSNTLVRLSTQWHGPDRMVLNPNHIVAVEPVATVSTVATLIEEAEKKK
ncbi:MAG TPA: hypothetical protein VK587_11940 [bacterium]|nr:hypothetical protein [bacterium]